MTEHLLYEGYADDSATEAHYVYCSCGWEAEDTYPTRAEAEAAGLAHTASAAAAAEPASAAAAADADADAEDDEHVTVRQLAEDLQCTQSTIVDVLGIDVAPTSDTLLSSGDAMTVWATLSAPAEPAEPAEPAMRATIAGQYHYNTTLSDSGAMILTRPGDTYATLIIDPDSGLVMVRALEGRFFEFRALLDAIRPGAQRVYVGAIDDVHVYQF